MNAGLPHFHFSPFSFSSLIHKRLFLRAVCRKNNSMQTIFNIYIYQLQWEEYLK